MMVAGAHLGEVWHVAAGEASVAHEGPGRVHVTGAGTALLAALAAAGYGLPAG
jgi:hypothetical protein